MEMGEDLQLFDVWIALDLKEDSYDIALDAEPSLIAEHVWEGGGAPQQSQAVAAGGAAGRRSRSGRGRRGEPVGLRVAQRGRIEEAYRRRHFDP